MTAAVECQTPHTKVILLSLLFREDIRFYCNGLTVNIPLTDIVTKDTINRLLHQLVVHLN